MQTILENFPSSIHFILDLQSTSFSMHLYSWVNEKTNGKIKEILPGSANRETRVILANALYFKAEWQESFIEGATGFKKFYPQGKDVDSSVQVELMAHGGELKGEEVGKLSDSAMQPWKFSMDSLIILFEIVTMS
jgi:serine protease inhibitor